MNGERQTRVGLVLGAGGVVGASWLIGSLQALAGETGWDPREAEYIVGTSAGSVIGALTAGGLDPDAMAASVRGDPVAELEEIQQLAESADRSGGTEYRLARGLPPVGPGSWRMAMSTLRHPLSHPAATVLSGWLPRGFISNDPVRRLVERFVLDDWPEHPNYWAVACDYGSGRRVAFGREDAPPARVGDAVAASCAIPAFYRPVRIAGRSYVDGGVCSPSNLDLLCGCGLDLVICLNPISSRAQPAGNGPAERVAAAVRAASGRRLGHEARKLRTEGTSVLLMQPTREDIAVMGVNLMSRKRRVEVIDRARDSAAAELARLADAGHPLPGRPLPGSLRPRARTGGRAAA
jgi:NTE family protein